MHAAPEATHATVSVVVVVAEVAVAAHLKPTPGSATLQSFPSQQGVASPVANVMHAAPEAAHAIVSVGVVVVVGVVAVAAHLKPIPGSITLHRFPSQQGLATPVAKVMHAAPEAAHATAN